MNLRSLLKPISNLHLALPSEYADRPTRLVYPIQLAMTAILFSALLFAIVLQMDRALPVLVSGFVGLAISVLFSRRGQMNTSALVLMTTMLVLVILLPIYGQGIHDITMIVYPVVLVLSSMLLERNAYILVSGLVLISVIGLTLLELTGQLVTELSFTTSLSDLVLLPTILALTAWSVRLLADRIAGSLEQAQNLAQRQATLIDEARRRAEHLAILNQVGLAVASGLNLEGMLLALHERLQVVTPNDTFYVAFYDAESDEISFPLFFELGRRLTIDPEAVRQRPGLTGEVIRSRRTIYLPDLHKNGEADSLDAAPAGDSNTRSYVGVPLFLKNEVIGVMSVQSQSPFAYHPEQIRLLEIIGSQAAIAIQNARLYAALQEELDQRKLMEGALHQRDSVLEAVTLAAGKFLIQADWRSDIGSVLARLGTELRVSSAALYQLQNGEENSALATLIAAWQPPGAAGQPLEAAAGAAAAETQAAPQPVAAPTDAPPAFPERAEAPVDLPGSEDWLSTMQAGRVIQVRVSELPGEQAERFTARGVRAFLNAPILFEGELWGFIGFYDNRAEREWSPPEVDAILLACGLLAAAIRRQQDDEEIHQLNAELEARVRERTADLESFAYSVAHDLRAPLRGIDGYSKLLAEDYGERIEAEGRTYLDNVRSAAQWMGQLIEDLLRLSRITRIEMRTTLVDLSAIAAEACTQLQAQAPERTVTWKIDPDLYVVADGSLIRLVVDNLLLNAWKFSAPNQQACIELSSEERDGRRVFFVRDNGVGFDMRYVDKLFNPFQRLHTSGDFEGTGVGLATVKRIIQRHDGEVWAEGSVGSGATFFFTLPA